MSGLRVAGGLVWLARVGQRLEVRERASGYSFGVTLRESLIQVVQQRAFDGKLLVFLVGNEISRNGKLLLLA